MGIKRGYVDELLRVGSDERQTHSDAMLERFETGGSKYAPFALAGMHITESENMYHVDQDF